MSKLRSSCFFGPLALLSPFDFHAKLYRQRPFKNGWPILLKPAIQIDTCQAQLGFVLSD
ncbi:MAG: hypothetical protein IPM53_17970 [Anaerolineaceae bacterium]|nr:hypothetical protein [Anaerolineaceae bacterium]